MVSSFVLAVFVAVIWLSYRRRVSNTAIPWTSTDLPFVGSAQSYAKDPVRFLLEQKAKLGDVFRVDLLVLRVTFLIGPKWNRWVLKETKEAQVSFWQAILTMHCGLIDKSMHFPDWLDRAVKALSTGMNRPARLEAYEFFFVSASAPILAAWSDSATPIPLFKASSDLILRSVMTAFYGPSFVAKHGNELVPLVREFERAFVDPWTRLVPLWASPSGRRLRRMYTRMKEVIEDEVRGRLERGEKGAESGEDYVSFLLSMDSRAEEFFPCYGEHLMMMVSAAHVNTAATFAWTLLHLLRNPHHLATFREEISSNPPSHEGIYPWREMPFGEACLRETGRLYTNLLMLRLLPQDIVVEGIVIPKGWLAISPLATQQDPTVYENPERWDATRWLASPDSYTARFRNSEFVQFGAGAHACLGEKFTHSLLRGVLWPALFDAYDLQLVHGIEDGEGMDGVGVAPNYRENMGTPLGVREIGLRVTRRKERLSDAGRDEARVKGTDI